MSISELKNSGNERTLCPCIIVFDTKSAVCFFLAHVQEFWTYGHPLLGWYTSGASSSSAKQYFQTCFEINFTNSLTAPCRTPVGRKSH